MKIRLNMRERMMLIVSCLAMGVGLCSCSSVDDSAPNPPADDGRAMRQLTITDASMSRRVAISPDTYAATWETGDKATYFNLNTQSGLWYGTLTATPTGSPVGASASLSGDAHCGLGDYLAVIYPTVGTIEQPSGNDPYFTIDLSGQKGTLEDIGDHYHYVYGVGEVTSVEGNTASGTISNTKGLLSLCKFTFKKDANPVSVNTLQIGYGSTGAAGYPQTGQVSMTDVIANVHVAADAPSGTPLTISLPDANPNPTGVVYVALFPDDVKNTFHFTVSDGTNTYTGTKKAVLKEGKYYEVDIAVN